MGKLQRVKLRGVVRNQNFRSSESTMWDEFVKKYKVQLKQNEVVLFVSRSEDQLIFVLNVHDVDPHVYAHSSTIRSRVQPEELEQMKQMREEGWTFQEIADETGRGITTIKSYAKDGFKHVTIAKPKRTGIKVLDTRRWRIVGGLWNRDMMQNYAESVGLHFDGIKRYEELAAEKDLTKLLVSV